MPVCVHQIVQWVQLQQYINLKKLCDPQSPQRVSLKSPLSLAASFGDVRYFQAILPAELEVQEGTEAWSPWEEGLWISGHLGPIAPAGRKTPNLVFPAIGSNQRPCELDSVERNLYFLFVFLITLFVLFVVVLGPCCRLGFPRAATSKSLSSCGARASGFRPSSRVLHRLQAQRLREL